MVIAGRTISFEETSGDHRVARAGKDCYHKDFNTVTMAIHYTRSLF